MRRQSAIPSPSRRWCSSSTTSGRSRASTWAASEAPAAAPTGTIPGSARRSMASPARTAGWGSMIATRVTGRTLPGPVQPDLNHWLESLTSSAVPTPNELELRGLTKRYDDGFLALDGVDLTVGDGEFFGLLGPNGA